VHVGHWTQAAVVHGGRWKQAARGVAGQASVRLVLHLVLDAVMCYTLALCSCARTLPQIAREFANFCVAVDRTCIQTSVPVRPFVARARPSIISK